MNNLKRVLSLGLTGAMLAGLLTVGASAANFTDAESIEHVDAVNTLVALKVIDGKPDGSFDPKGDVTRAEMAKMIATAMNGGNKANTGVKTTPSFTDIKGHWAESEIEYCSDLKIISGRGDGTFDPDSKVTGLEATKMVLTALGYDANAFKLTGAAWAVQTDELARKADPSLYENLETVMMATNASREVAAQLIWNGLQNNTQKIEPGENKNNGEITWNYKPGPRMLKVRYGADIWVGTYTGNSDSISGLDKGHIQMDNAGDIDTEIDSRSATVDFPSDLGIENIGEEIKVVYKDGNGNGNKKGQPDKRDTIYGVFNTGATEVYKVTMNDMQDAGSDLTKSQQKIKFSGAKHNIDTANGVDVQFNYDSSNDVNFNATQLQNALKAQSMDQIKFVCDPDGYITKAYVTTRYISRVTSVTASKITIQGVGSIDIADNDIYEAPAVDDVVVFSRFYSDSTVGDAFFTVTKAESVEGKLTGFKKDKYTSNNLTGAAGTTYTVSSSDGKGGAYLNIVVDGTTTKVNKPFTSLTANLTDDAILNFTDSVRGDASTAGIGDTVKLYLVDGLVGCVQLVSGEGGKYAVVTETSGSGTYVDKVMNPLRVSVILPDGTEQTLLVHKDSTYDDPTSSDSKKFKDLAGDTQYAKFDLAADGGTVQGALVEYSSISNGTIKIKRVAKEMSNYTAELTAGKLWDEKTKKLQYTAGTSAVAAIDAPMFVGVDRDSAGTQNGTVNNWYAYDLRSLGDIGISYSQGTNGHVGVQYFTNKDGLITAAATVMANRPGSTTADTLYGMVTSYVGTRQNSAGDDLWLYTVTVGRDEDVTVAVNQATEGIALPNGSLVTFDERADGEYVLGQTIEKLRVTAGTDVTLVDGTLVKPAAIRSYNSDKNLLTYWAATSRADVDSDFSVEALNTAGTDTVSKDVKIVYVNSDDKKAGDEIGVASFDATKGYANAMMHFNKDNIIDVIIIETSGKGNLDNPNCANSATALFGATDSMTLPAAPSVTSGKSGAYTVTMSPAAGEKAGVGSTVTISIKCTTAPNADETITLAADANIENISAGVTFGTGDVNKTKDITFKVKTTTAATLTLSAS